MKSIMIGLGLIVWGFASLHAQKVASGSRNTSKPNIIFILADDLGSAELGCYGNRFNETPNLDRLAGEGAKFTQAYSAAPICSPSRAAIMTGQYPARIGITDFLDNNSPRFLDPSKYVTLNEALSSAGYHTGIIGKWHLDTKFKNPQGNPHQHGFDEVIGSETKYIADGDYFYPYDKTETLNAGGKDGEYLTDRQCLEASRFIERNKSRPFFLYLAFYSVHTRLDAPQNLADKYKARFDKKYGAGKADELFEKNARHEGQHLDNPYLAAMIERMDVGVGSILHTLKEQGLDRNTMVIFFSDNGGVGNLGNNGILRAGKSWLYEGGIRENLIVRWPTGIKPGTVVNTPVCGTDFYPTFLEAAGAEKYSDKVVDGKSFYPLLRGINPGVQRNFFWHYISETGKWVPRMCSAVRSGDYKLLHFYAGDRIELYNLRNDPSEKNNIAANEPAKARELKAALDNWRREVNAEAPQLP
jgi:arylsulfatase A-like enzyme